MSSQTGVISIGTYEGRLFGWNIPSDVISASNSTKASGGVAAKPELSFAFAAHEGPVRCVAIDDSGKFFVTGGTDEAIRIYNLRRKREVGVLLEHTDEITCLAFVGKGFLLSGGADNTICIWRTSDWLCLHKLGGHKAAVTSVAPHPSGKLALSTGKDRTLRLWDLVKGRIAFITRLEEVGEKVFWSPNAEQYCIMYRSKLVVHDGGNGDVVCTLSREVRIHDAVWTKSGHILAACDESKLVVWSADGAFIREVVTPHKFRVRNVSALTAESSVVTSDPEGLVLSPVTFAVKVEDAGSSRCTCLVAYSRDPDAVVGGDEGEDDAKPVKQPQKSNGHHSSGSVLKPSKKSKDVASNGKPAKGKLSLDVANSTSFGTLFTQIKAKVSKKRTQDHKKPKREGGPVKKRK